MDEAVKKTYMRARAARGFGYGGSNPKRAVSAAEEKKDEPEITIDVKQDELVPTTDVPVAAE